MIKILFVFYPPLYPNDLRAYPAEEEWFEIKDNWYNEEVDTGDILHMPEYEIVIFETEDKSITLPVSVRNDTVWLSANQMAELFERDEKTIRKHINNVFSEGEVERENNTQKMRVADYLKLLIS